MFKKTALIALTLTLLAGGSKQVYAAECQGLPGYDALKKALSAARNDSNGGLNNDMWGAIVDRTGQVCSVAYTGENLGDQWPGSRAIAVEKANTANAFSLPGFALSTANLYAGTQPGGFLFGLPGTNPVEPHDIAAGSPKDYGTANDPLVGKRPGGIVVFGGGLALYDTKGALLGAVGVSGDTSCADHNIAWKTRSGLGLDYVPNGPGDKHNDQIIYDIGLTGKSASGFGQPGCGGKEEDMAKKLPATETVAK